jgi:hypothetical protein
VLALFGLYPSPRRRDADTPTRRLAPPGRDYMDGMELMELASWVFGPKIVLYRVRVSVQDFEKHPCLLLEKRKEHTRFVICLFLRLR